MSNLDTINVGGIDFDIEDSVARSNAAVVAYKETGSTASQAYSVLGTPINWNGVLYYTTATIAAGDTLEVGTNLASAINIGRMLSNIKTYVGQDEMLHFRDATGADSVLPFSSGGDLENENFTLVGETGSFTAAVAGSYFIIACGAADRGGCPPGEVSGVTFSITVKVNNTTTISPLFSYMMRRFGQYATNAGYCVAAGPSCYFLKLEVGDTVSVTSSKALDKVGIYLYEP